MHKCSVIIPAFNCEDTLLETTASVLASGLDITEVIIVNDGSTDRTPQIAQSFQLKFGNIKLIEQENKGVSAARNRGLEEATGDYIWFCDSDDLVDKGSMTHICQMINERAPDMLVFGMSFDYYFGKRLFRQETAFYREETEMHQEELEKAFSELYYSNSLTSSCNRLIRRSILIDNGVFFDPSLFSMEDFHFVLSVLRHCKSVYFLPQALYHYVIQTKKSRRKSGRNHDRMARIPNIADYLVSYEDILSNHKDILINLYYMILNEKLSAQRPKQIAVTAEQFCAGPYSHEKMLSLCSPQQRKLAEQLTAHKNYEIYFQILSRKAKKTVKRFVRLIWGILSQVNES
ncbi:MAG: glycosyltransferase family 2 protein [Oscillospiraceae bacterium]|nr:glycosyltransferase family 2 protein [Oscillospiraceae bacterium]